VSWGDSRDDSGILCEILQSQERRNLIEQAKLAEMRAARHLNLNYAHDVRQHNVVADRLTAKALGEATNE